MKQVYILLTKTDTVTSRIVHTFTRGTYTHAALALTPETDKFYSYARRRLYNFLIGGVINENVNTFVYARFPDSNCALFELDVSDEDYERIKGLLLFDGNRAKVLSIFYEMVHKLSSSYIPSELLPAIKYINDNYSDPELDNGELAKRCNISEVYFRKLFLKHFKVSPRQFIIDYRIQCAKRLLCEDVMKISALSEACGFASAYHFCRVFKQRTGLTPSEYREENRIIKT